LFLGRGGAKAPTPLVLVRFAKEPPGKPGKGRLVYTS
jgi:hypothetical protein